MLQRQLSNRQVLNTILYVAEHVCKWRVFAGAVRQLTQLTHYLQADEPTFEKRDARPGLRTIAAPTDRAHRARGGVDG